MNSKQKKKNKILVQYCREKKKKLIKFDKSKLYLPDY
jgi:hypothetical protein